MAPLDLKEFVWQSKKTKIGYIILAITTYKGDDVVIYREAKDRSKICIDSVDEFCKRCEATYQL
jgi:hypothetical protein